MFTHYELMLLQAIEHERELQLAAAPRRRRVAAPRWAKLAGRRAARAARAARATHRAQVQAPAPSRTAARAPAPPPGTRDPAPAGAAEMPAANGRPAGTLAACAASGGQTR